MKTNEKEKKEGRFSNAGPDSLGSYAWWLYETKGASFLDKLVLSILKAIFQGTRFLLRVIAGRERRDALFVRRNINFKDFLYKATGPFGLGRVSLEIFVPKYDYKVHCPLNREDFIVMTKHEDEILDHFVPAQGDTVVDIGAHMGRYTIVSSKRVGPSGKVIAIEAHPVNFKLLNRNIKLNRLTNVITINSAVYSKEMPLKLYLPDEEQGYTMHHSVMAGYLSTKYKRDIVEQNYIQVQADTLDSLLQRAKVEKVDWIKIDVEGAEFEVLKGVGETLTENKDITLLIEIHGKETYELVLGFIRSHGFRLEFEKTYDNGEKHVFATKSG